MQSHAIFFVIPIACFIAAIWVYLIDKMHTEHPDYKGEDFLNWDGKNPWDDKKKKEEKDKS